MDAREIRIRDAELAEKEARALEQRKQVEAAQAVVMVETQRQQQEELKQWQAEQARRFDPNSSPGNYLQTDKKRFGFGRDVFSPKPELVTSLSKEIATEADEKKKQVLTRLYQELSSYVRGIDKDGKEVYVAIPKTK